MEAMKSYFKICSEPNGGWERHLLDASDGSGVDFYYLPAIADARGSILYLATDTDITGLMYNPSHHANVLRHCGYNVLTFDFAAVRDRGILTTRLIERAGSLSRRLGGDLPVGILGISHPGAWALHTLNQGSGIFETAVIDSAPARLRMPPTFIGQTPTWRNRLKQLFRKGSNCTIELSEGIVNIKTGTSLLLIYGKRDTLTPPRIGQQYFAACEKEWRPLSCEPDWLHFPSVHYEVWEPDADHARALYEQPAEYLERIMNLHHRNPEDRFTLSAYDEA